MSETDPHGEERKGNTTAVKLKQVQYFARYFGLKNKPSTGATCRCGLADIGRLI